jgi:hypothetical protein
MGVRLGSIHRDASLRDAAGQDKVGISSGLCGDQLDATRWAWPITSHQIQVATVFMNKSTRKSVISMTWRRRGYRIAELNMTKSAAFS